MKAIIKSVLALALSSAAMHASASILVSSNDFEDPKLKGWTYSPKTSKIGPAANDPTNKVMQFTRGNGGENNDNALNHNFARQDGDILISFDFLYTGVMAVNTFLGVYVDPRVDSPSFGIKSDCDDKSGACKNDVFVRMSEKGTVMMLGSDLAANTTYTIFGRLYKDNGSASYNRFDAWLNPTTDEMNSLTGWNASATGNTNIESVDKLRIRTFFPNSASTLQIDNLQVSQVPEPGTLSLIGLAMAGVAFSRRKRA